MSAICKKKGEFSGFQREDEFGTVGGLDRARRGSAEAAQGRGDSWRCGGAPAWVVAVLAAGFEREGEGELSALGGGYRTGWGFGGGFVREIWGLKTPFKKNCTCTPPGRGKFCPRRGWPLYTGRGEICPVRDSFMLKPPSVLLFFVRYLAQTGRFWSHPGRGYLCPVRYSSSPATVLTYVQNKT